MAKKNLYNLYGVLNLFGKVPGFVHPVFHRNGNFYFGICDDTSTYKHFEIIENGEIINKIRPLNNISSKTILGVKNGCSIGDPVLYGIEQQPNVIYIANIDKMLKFLETYRTSDDEFSEQISLVKNEIKTLKKRK